MDIVVKSRHHEVTDRFRRHATEKLSKVERMDERAISLTVELLEERNPRQTEQRDRIELTLNSPGPVVRAEAAASDPYSALDLAVVKLEAQLRRASDRRKINRNRKAISESIKHIPPMSGLEGLEPLLPPDGTKANGHSNRVNGASASYELDEADQGPMVVREKTHEAVPMTLDQALYEMELVGHDFYLYVDKGSGYPAVVYRRRAYDYGVIHLASEASAEGSPSDRMVSVSRM